MMFKSFTLLSAFATLVVAQSSTSTANPLIPSSGVSSSCLSFFNSFDGNSTLITCIQPAFDTISAFGPTSSGTASSTSGVQSALDSFCSNDISSCSNIISDQLLQFQMGCSAELLTNPVSEVIQLYDLLWVLAPLSSAICTKDTNGTYCALESNATNPSSLENFLWSDVSPSSSSSPLITVNSTTYNDNSIPFFFMQPQSAPCTTCSYNIFSSYFRFQTSNQYAPDPSNSQLFGDQLADLSTVYNDCAQEWDNQGGLEAAGSLSDHSLLGGAVKIAGDVKEANLAMAVMVILGLFVLV